MFNKFLVSSSIVNQSYAAACIEKLLIKKNKGSNMSVVTSENIDQSIVVGLLTNLCNLLNDQKNLYAIRALYRVLQVSKEKVLMFAENLG